MSLRSRRRATLTGLLSLLLLMPMGCDKPDAGGGTDAPGGAGGAAEEDGIRLAYNAEGFKLKATVSLSQESAGMQVGGTELEIVGTIEATPTDGGMLLVVSTIDEVKSIEFSGDTLKQLKGEEGNLEIPDFKTELKGFQTFQVVDPKTGEADQEKTDALQQNKDRKADMEKKREAGEDLRFFMVAGTAAQAMSLSGLPEVALNESGETKAPTKTEEEDLFGAGKMKLERDVTYNMKSVADGVMTFEFASAAGGADEVQTGQGAMFITFDQESEGELTFDNGNGVPKSASIEQAVAISVGDQGSIELFVELEAEFEKM